MLLSFDSLEHWESFLYFGRQESEKQQTVEAAENQAHIFVEGSRSAFKLGLLQQGYIWSYTTIAIVIATYQVLHQQQPPASLATVVWYLHQLHSRVHGNPYLEDWYEAAPNAKMLHKLFSIQPSVVDGPHLFNLHRGDITFEDVSFSYDNDRTLLHGLNFKIECGQHAAIIGEAATGKTTILRLLFRFYDVSKGRILIDGQDVRDVTMESFRQFVGVVPQEVALLDDTIMENVRFAQAGATDQEVIEACKSASIHAHIQELPLGYATRIGQNGLRLSSGQRQMLAIARVLLKNPPIVILDEAFNDLDSASAKTIQNSLQKVTSSRTVLTAAHRYDTSSSPRGFTLPKG